MIRGILFDAHDTLIERDPGKISQAIDGQVTFLNKQGYRVTREEYVQCLRNVARQHAADPELNEVTISSWYSEIWSCLGIKDFPIELPETAHNLWTSDFAASARAIEGALPLLETLKKDYLLGVVSNSFAESTRKDFSAAGLGYLLDSLITSTMVGKRKPHPLIFLKALEELKVAPQEAVFVGNSLYEDIYGAQQVGMKAVLFKRAGPSPQFGFASPPGKEVIDKVKPDAVISSLAELPEVIRAL